MTPGIGETGHGAGDQPARTLVGAPKLDVRPVKAFRDGSDIAEQAVAVHVAKYPTKAAETTGTLDRRIGELAELDRHGVPDHPRRLIEACKLLDPLYPDRRLWGRELVAERLWFASEQGLSP